MPNSQTAQPLQPLLHALNNLNLPYLRLKAHEVLPIVQGGMGVGVSAHKLAGAVAAQGGIGTLSSVDLRRHHPDLMAQTQGDRNDAALKDKINAINLIALDREIQLAKKVANGLGLIAVNVMRAVSEYAEYVRQACRSGADMLAVGAGLPLDLPELTQDYPHVALVPIISDARTAQLILRKWERKNRLPDAFIIEHPGYAGGHLGATQMSEVHDARFDFEKVIPETLAVLEKHGLSAQSIPLIPAGGINSHERVQQLFALGARGVQLGTAFAVTQEGDAHVNFKKVLAEAKPEDMVEFMSVAGLPARAVRTPWLDKYLSHEQRMQDKAKAKPRCMMAFDCLAQCGLRDGNPKAGQFCIDHHLAAALHGQVDKGLFFRGGSSLPFGEQIRSVRELMQYLLNGIKPDLSTHSTLQLA
ncbi:NAD(P)H-dependent flavin oxidoreductase [Parvibium lacunae]|uniref:Nitronate monooxygenase n=1 Tax=Parvibium lacunae TaxID=1888893 RepID=A0A368L732_9BURK|nr:nitronate monooxygenase family protein [Parvibium lacunae]RCS59498.1 nitronate monooxygenase [Parvibium lacunae]